MNIFMKTVSISDGLISPVIYIGNTDNGYHLSGSKNLSCRRKLTPREKCNVYMTLTFINFSWRLWAHIKHVYLMKFTQVVWLLTNWWIGMNETNLTQHGRSTDVNASHVLYLRDKKKTLKKRGNLLRNGFLLRQFMSWKNINQNNYSLCKSSSDHKSAGIWI